MSENTLSTIGKTNSDKYLFDQPKITRDDFLAEFINQLIQRRLHLKLTQEDVDLRMGNADRQCSKWECGLRTPTSFNLYCWAEALNSKLCISSIPE